VSATRICLSDGFLVVLSTEGGVSDSIPKGRMKRANRTGLKRVVKSTVTGPHSACLMASSTGTGRSNIPRPSKSRLPVLLSSSGARPTTPRDQPPATASPSPRPAASPSTPRVPKSPAARPRTISTNVKSQSSSDRVPHSDRPRPHSVTKTPSRSRLRPKEPEPATPAKAAPAISMKEAIALKRAEAKKAMAAQKTLSEHVGSSGVEDTLPTTSHAVDEDDLGRLSIRETIERARSSGVHWRTLWFVCHSADPLGHAPKARSTSRHATSYVSPPPYSRSISQ
jgi:hypothetical protein